MPALEEAIGERFEMAPTFVAIFQPEAERLGDGAHPQPGTGQGAGPRGVDRRLDALGVGPLRRHG